MKKTDNIFIINISLFTKEKTIYFKYFNFINKYLFNIEIYKYLNSKFLNIYNNLNLFKILYSLLASYSIFFSIYNDILSNIFFCKVNALE